MIRSRYVFVGLLALGWAGCAGRSLPTCYPVRGKVLIDGRPAAGALVFFNPVEGGRPQAVKPHATTDAEGVFRLTTYHTGDGAEPGEYVVTLFWPDGNDPDAPDRLKGRYANPKKSAWRATVAAGDNDIGTIEVKQR